MSRFWAGFAIASLVWGAAGAYLYFVAGFGPAEAPVIEAAVAAPVEDEVAAAEPARPRRRGRRRARADRADSPEATPTGNATVGDDLGEDEMRTLDMGGAGGEQQLRGAQIEAGFDAGMGRIRRCLVLMAGEEAVTGQLVFGLRIAPTGQVTRVRLSGPRAATTGDAGTCLSAAARGLRFDAFDGPEMVVRYPLTLE